MSVQWTENNRGSDTLIRVVLAGLSEVLEAILNHIFHKHPDIEIVQVVDGDAELLVASQMGVDIVLLGADKVSPCPKICSHLFNQFPEVKVIVISQNGEQAIAYWLGMQLSAVDMRSNMNLIYMIKTLSSQSFIE